MSTSNKASKLISEKPIFSAATRQSYKVDEKTENITFEKANDWFPAYGKLTNIKNEIEQLNVSS